MANLLSEDLRALHDPEFEALVEMLIIAASADGEIAAEERTHLVSSIESLTDHRLSNESLSKLVEDLEKTLTLEGVRRRLESVAERLPTPRSRHIALSLCVRLTAVDGIIRTSERELIAEAAEVFGISGDQAADIVRATEE